jgi:hypothetical protein
MTKLAARMTSRSLALASAPVPSYLSRPGGRIGYDVAAAWQPGLVSGLVLIGPFVRDAEVSAVQRALLRAAMAPPWAARAWKAYLPKLYAGRPPADFGEYRDQVAAALRRPRYASAFSRTTCTSHAAARARLADVRAPALIVMGEQDPTSRTRGQKLTGRPAPWAAGSSWCPRPATIRSRSGPASPPEPSCASSIR